MNTPKNLNRPDSSIALPLKPAQLNKLRLSVKHTVLTPELLENKME